MITKGTLVVSIIIFLVIGWLIGYYTRPNQTLLSSNNNVSVPVISGDANEEIALYGTMRKLWSDHVLWTREYMIATISGAPSATSSAARLMKNQEDIGRALAGYYGTAAANDITNLLKEHISIATEVVTAAKVNDRAKFTDANNRWNANAQQIATFLSVANPNWPRSTLESLLSKHLSTTADELTAIINRQYDASVRAFDTVFDHMMETSDALSAGIIKQFPTRF